MSRPITKLGLSPRKLYGVTKRHAQAPTRTDVADARAKRQRTAEWIARHARRAAFIEAERLSRSEASHLPIDFDPADRPELHQ